MHLWHQQKRSHDVYRCSKVSGVWRSYSTKYTGQVFLKKRVKSSSHMGAQAETQPKVYFHLELAPSSSPTSCTMRTEQTAPSPSQSTRMHLHLLPLSGEATSAGTVAKKKKGWGGERQSTPQRHMSPILLGKQTHSATEVTESKWEQLWQWQLLWSSN